MAAFSAIYGGALPDGVLGTEPSMIFVMIGAISVLLSELHPSGTYDFPRRLNRWNGRLLAYPASLVESYSLFLLDTGSLSREVTASS